MMVEENSLKDKLQELDACVGRLNGCISFLEERTAEHQRLLLSVRNLLKRTLELRTKIELLGVEPGEADISAPAQGIIGNEAPDPAEPSEEMVERLLFEIDQEWNGPDKESGLEPELH